MPYPNQHRLLTVNGGLFTGAETWSFGLRFSGASVPTQADVNACQAPIKTWWQSSGFSAVHTLNYLKLAPIGTDGRYPPGTDSVEYDYVPNVQGAGTGTSVQAAQVAIVMSLTTGIPRGRGHIGRVYLPAPQFGLVSGGGYSDVDVDGLLAPFRTMVLALNAIPGMGNLSVITKLGSAALVTGIRCGHMPDTMRSRRRGLIENPRALAL